MKEEKKDNENKDNLNINQNATQIQSSSDIADSVVTIILDKIISNAVINSKINDIYKTMNDHCFNFLTEFMNPYLKNNFIFYENGIDDLEYQKKQIYYCYKPINKLNTWNILPEPKSNEVDRCANTKAKMVKYKKYTDLKDNGLKESSFALDAEEDIKHLKSDDHNVFDENEDRTNYNLGIKSKKDNKYNIVKNKTENNLQKIKEKQNKEKEKKEEEKKEKDEKNKKERINIYFNNDFPKKKEKEEVLELSTLDDLPKEAYENKYSIINSNDENNRLRREKEIEIQKREEMKILEKENQDRKNRQQLMKRMEKEFDGNRYTFDPNGKIINLRSKNYENLEGGFIFSRQKIKTEKNNKKRQPISLMDVVYPVEGVDQTEKMEENEEDDLNIKTPIKVKGKKSDSVVNKIESDLSKINVIKNEDEFLINENENKFNKKEKKESVVPSGANFDKIVPEVGVIIRGENMREVKEGGFDYVKKYNKHSFNELSRYISDSANLNSHNFSSINSNNDINKNNNNINNYGNNDYLRTEENNYVGYRDEFNDSNPLIQNAHNLNNKNNLNNYSSDLNRYYSLNAINLNNNSKRRSLLKSYDRIKTENDQSNIIQLSKNLNSQKLTNIFDDTLNNNNNFRNSLDIDNFENLNYLERAVLPFKNLRYKKQNGIRKLINIDNTNNNERLNADQAFMNKFNSQIVKNKEWGKEEEDVYKIQEKLNKEMSGENQDKSMFRRRRDNNRMKILGMQIMNEGNNIRQRKIPIFGGNLK